MRLSGQLLEGMSLALEDAGDVVLRLHNGIIEEAVGMRDELPNLVGDKMIEDREYGVDHEDDRDDIVDGHHAGEGERAEDVGPMDDQTCQQQDDDGCGLEPVPEAAIEFVHVNALG